MDVTMFNFLDPRLMPKVRSDAPFTDNFEPSNLIDENEAVRARGFMAYPITKPPVSLEFELICPIDISFITLNTTVGRQKCTGIELFAKTTSGTFISIGKSVYDSPGVTFCNSRKYSKENPPPCHLATNNLSFFKSNTGGVFSNTSFVKAVIFRTNWCVPCLGSVKIYGGPSRTCTPTTIHTINKLMGIVPKAAPVEPKQTNNAIPEDFLDDLTCEIMTIPMTLPSGKTVDRDTLEKHLDNEKSFGRKPGDPFTGLKFTETRKPVMNVALKSRIDMFLMQNSDKPFTFGLKRTLGSEKVYFKKFKSETKCFCGCDEQLYVIPCQHYYCRNCLLKLERYKCDVCGRDFERNEAKRHHN